jgi:hypothetical protein
VGWALCKRTLQAHSTNPYGWPLPDLRTLAPRKGPVRRRVSVSISTASVQPGLRQLLGEPCVDPDAFKGEDFWSKEWVHCCTTVWVALSPNVNLSSRILLGWVWESVSSYLPCQNLSWWTGRERPGRQSRINIFIQIRSRASCPGCSCGHSSGSRCPHYSVYPTAPWRCLCPVHASGQRPAQCMNLWVGF